MRFVIERSTRKTIFSILSRSNFRRDRFFFVSEIRRVESSKIFSSNKFSFVSPIFSFLSNWFFSFFNSFELRFFFKLFLFSFFFFIFFKFSDFFVAPRKIDFSFSFSFSTFLRFSWEFYLRFSSSLRVKWFQLDFSFNFRLFFSNFSFFFSRHFCRFERFSIFSSIDKSNSITISLWHICLLKKNFWRRFIDWLTTVRIAHSTVFMTF